jgi:putative protease
MMTLKKHNNKSDKPELIAPAGDIISLRDAIKSGADSLYFGVDALNMRINAKNFTIKDLRQISKIASNSGVKTYLTLNTIIYDNEQKKIERIIRSAKKAKIDAIICWDPSVINACKKQRIPFHISTQANISNYEALVFYSKLGAKYAVLSRELSIRQIKSIINKAKKDNLKIKIETFIHGAMCVSVSGRCYTSQFLFGRSANRGDCLQPCRREYKIVDPEEKKELKLKNNFVMSPKDLCTIDFIDKLIDSGIHAFKIEGRNRSPEYVKTVTQTYRKAIDLYISQPKVYENSKSELKKELEKVYNRGFSNGFYLGKPIGQWTDAYGSKASLIKRFIGKVTNYYKKIGIAEIMIQTASLRKGDTIMIMGPTTGSQTIVLDEFMVEENIVKKASKKEIMTLLSPTVRKNDQVYKLVPNKKT